jgi:hypothetical protein
VVCHQNEQVERDVTKLNILSASFLSKKWEIEPSELALLEKIGTGATATVWKALWNNIQVIFKKSFSNFQVAVKQFEWERMNMESNLVEYKKEISFLRYPS